MSETEQHTDRGSARAAARVDTVQPRRANGAVAPRQPAGSREEIAAAMMEDYAPAFARLADL
ncbi:hypothetical protein ACFU8R_14090 [Pseudonocardia alni]|uniref:hypothetical protein n=1 Tax=Pseudonocardia alni TaxID=33907 RepID=UPI00280BD2D1|nr:hypothetical protein [Pseudonocardia alni]